MPSASAAGADATIFNTTSFVVSASTTIFTGSSVSIGTAASGRRVIVAFDTVYAGTAGTAIGLTIGGVTAVLCAVGTSSGGGAGPSASLWNLQVDSGNTATIVGTFSASAPAAGFGVWAAYDLLNTAAVATAVSTTNPMVASINIDAGGVAAGVVSDFAGTAPSHTWTGIVEDYDSTIGGSSSHSGASKSTTTALSPAVMTCTPNISTTRVMIVASFR